uniref:Uncharacterized protein n=1 Tax=Arundo donax TaxID=35708 RepID=A0A0A9DPU9_ARUDO
MLLSLSSSLLETIPISSSLFAGSDGSQMRGSASKLGNTNGYRYSFPLSKSGSDFMSGSVFNILL